MARVLFVVLLAFIIGMLGAAGLTLAFFGDCGYLFFTAFFFGGAVQYAML